MADRYLKTIVTLIAVELLWLGLHVSAPPVLAQSAPTRVVIAGVQIGGRDGDALPVALVGSFREIPPGLRPTVEPTTIKLAGPVTLDPRTPVQIEARRPLKIEADRPLKVESVTYTPGQRPGD